MSILEGIQRSRLAWASNSFNQPTRSAVAIRRFEHDRAENLRAGSRLFGKQYYRERQGRLTQDLGDAARTDPDPQQTHARQVLKGGSRAERHGHSPGATAE